jgi:dUTP pyrophosphatase
MKVRIINKSENPLPAYQTPGSAGIDLCADDNVYIPAGFTKKVSTGIYLEIPQGYEAQVRSRSGLAAQGIVVANSPGTIDSDYRGEVCVLLHNNSAHSYSVGAGYRIAQLVFAPVIQVELEEVSELSDTERGTGGFGSTGV